MVSVSDLMNVLKAVLLIGMAAAPMLSRRVLNSGEFKIFTTSALSLSRTGLGVLLGANMPTQKVYSEPVTPASTVVGVLVEVPVMLTVVVSLKSPTVVETLVLSASRASRLPPLALLMDSVTVG